MFLRAITALAFSMLVAALASRLVAPAGCSKRLSPGLVGAAVEAIQVAAITVAADHHLTTAADTIVETSTVLHRHNPSEKNCAGTGREPATARYCAADRV